MPEKPDGQSTEAKEKAVSFPIESLFPGIHAAKPEVAEAEGWSHLLHGHLSGGFDVTDSATRARLLDVAPAAFVAFQLAPVPEPFARQLADGADPVAVCAALGEHLALPAHLCAIVTPENEVWIYPR